MPDHSGGDPSSEAGDVFRRNAAALLRRAQSAERKGLRHLERGLFLSAIEDLTEAVETYRNIDEAERGGSAEQYLALALYEQGDVEQAVSIWEGLVDKGWTRPTTLNFLVRHYERSGDPGEVDRLYARLAEAKARNTEFFDDFRSAKNTDTQPQSPPEEEKPTILIADNDPAVREVLGRMMTFQGYVVLYAEDGEAALSAIFESSPDLILLDVYMPKQSGLDVLYRMRAEGMGTPVVVISGGSYATMVRDAKLLGARFLAKPINFEELESTVKELLAGPEAFD